MAQSSYQDKFDEEKNDGNDPSDRYDKPPCCTKTKLLLIVFLLISLGGAAGTVYAIVGLDNNTSAINTGERGGVGGGTSVPVASPTAAPVKSPTAAPVADPAVVCNLRAVLKFTFDTADAAEYYGYHSDYMEVAKAGDDYYPCSNYYQDELPAWCTYENSSPEGDSAYVSHVDDTYEDLNLVNTETIEISGFAGDSYEIRVSHYFYQNDYYANSAGWDDHMLAAVLQVTNMSTAQEQLSSGGWSHPVDLWTPTHIKDDEGKDMMNPDYEGKFKVTVDCDDACVCAASYVLV